MITLTSKPLIPSLFITLTLTTSQKGVIDVIGRQPADRANPGVAILEITNDKPIARSLAFHSQGPYPSSQSPYSSVKTKQQKKPKRASSRRRKATGYNLELQLWSSLVYQTIMMRKKYGHDESERNHHNKLGSGGCSKGSIYHDWCACKCASRQLHRVEQEAQHCHM